MAVKKDEKRGTWYFYGKRKDFTGKVHAYKRRGFRTKREAKAAEAEFLKGTDSSTTLDELVELYKSRSGAIGIKETTLYRQSHDYDKQIKPYFGTFKLDDITVDKLEQWILVMKDKGLKHSTINLYKGVLSKFLNYAKRLGLISTNPCSLVPNLKPSLDDESKQLKCWDQATFDKFIRSVKDINHKEIYYFLWETGVRAGEMLGIRWCDIDLKHRTAHIAQSVSSSIGRGHFVTTPKNRRSVRTIDLPTGLTNRLKLRYERESLKDGFSPEFYIFGDIAPSSAKILGTWLDKDIESADVPRITPHGFRHSHASILIAKGVPDTLIADRLGHTVVELHRTYAHIYKSQHDALKDKLDDIFR